VIDQISAYHAHFSLPFTFFLLFCFWWAKKHVLIVIKLVFMHDFILRFKSWVGLLNWKRCYFNFFFLKKSWIVSQFIIKLTWIHCAGWSFISLYCLSFKRKRNFCFSLVANEICKCIECMFFNVIVWKLINIYKAVYASYLYLHMYVLLIYLSIKDNKTWLLWAC